MFIAHLPAGYLLARSLSKDHLNKKWLVFTGLGASILPDTDLLWFYLVDNRQSVHHAYLFHMPFFWIALGALSLAITRLKKWRRAEPFIGVALLCLLLHMLLDTVAAEIGWLRPFSAIEWNLIKVPARFDWWVWSFVFHWTFLLELAIISAAAVALRQDLRARGVTRRLTQRPLRKV
ncbi:MAG: metal-dependent hydrolase [Paracoccaceae bacterium]